MNDVRGTSTRAINLREITIEKTVKMKKTGKVRFVSINQHHLTIGEPINIQIDKENEADSYEVNVEEIIDDHAFIVNDVFETLTDKIVIFRHNLTCQLLFRLF